MQDAGRRIQDSGFIKMEFRNQDSGFRIQDSECRIWDSGFRIQDSEFMRFQGSGFSQRDSKEFGIERKSTFPSETPNPG